MWNCFEVRVHRARLSSSFLPAFPGHCLGLRLVLLWPAPTPGTSFKHNQALPWQNPWKKWKDLSLGPTLPAKKSQSKTSPQFLSAGVTSHADIYNWACQERSPSQFGFLWSWDGLLTLKLKVTGRSMNTLGRLHFIRRGKRFATWSGTCCVCYTEREQHLPAFVLFPISEGDPEGSHVGNVGYRRGRLMWIFRPWNTSASQSLWQVSGVLSNYFSGLPRVPRHQLLVKERTSQAQHSASSFLRHELKHEAEGGFHALPASLRIPPGLMWPTRTLWRIDFRIQPSAPAWLESLWLRTQSERAPWKRTGERPRLWWGERKEGRPPLERFPLVLSIWCKWGSTKS